MGSGHLRWVALSVYRQHRTNPTSALGFLILLAQPLNEYLRSNWKAVVSQNYFDENGLFFSIFWSGPLLVVFAVATVRLLLPHDLRLS